MGEVLVHVLLFFFSQMSKQPSLWYVSEEQAIFRVKSSEKNADGSVNVRRVWGEICQLCAVLLQSV